MDYILYFWSFLFIVLSAILLFRYLCGKQVGDGSMLIFGLAYYCFLPFVVYGANAYEGGPGASTWLDLFQPIYDGSLTVVVFFALLILSFLFGNVLPVPKFWVGFNRPIDPKVLNISFVLLFILWLIFLYQARANLFVGYIFGYDSSLMGPLATVNLISVLILLNVKQWRQSQSAEIFFSVLLLANSLCLLSMGGRMYVIAPLVSLFLQYINSMAKEVASRLKLFLVLALVVFLLLAIGIWRVGEDFNVSALLKIGLAESILTSVSMASVYDCEEMALFRFPSNFLSSIINFIPSGIFQNKSDYIFSLEQTSRCFFSPFGASHIGAMLLLNFGVFGACIFMFAFSVFLKSFRLVDKKGWWLYYYFCGLIPFMFFRDGFVIFNKALVGSGILIVLAMFIMGRLRIK